jgi:putative ABC transport system substrate-binding protein
MILDFRLPIFDYGEKQMHKTSRMRFALFCSDNRKFKIQNRKWLGLSIITFVLVVAGALVEAQQPKKVPRVCYLGNTASGRDVASTRFRERLRELGYIEGQNIAFEPRYWEGKVERLPKLAAELVRLKCDVIFTTGNEAAEAAVKATKEIPIVIANTGDAVRSGFVASLARPGGNVTGLTSVGAELNGKKLELLREVIPKLSRIAFIWSPTSPIAGGNLKETEIVARSLRIEIQPIEVKERDDIEKAFQAATKKRAEAIIIDSGGFFAFNQNRLLEQAAKSRLPAIYSNARYVEAGGLMTYSHDRNVQYQRAAEYVDKILKGAKPADLPVERPKKFELIINLKTAKQIGLTIPQKVLARADRVIR